MGKLFAGLFFIYVNFDITLGNIKIGLFPDFLGYIILIISLNELEEYSLQFTKARPIAIILACYTSVLYLGDLFGYSYGQLHMAVILGILYTIMLLFDTYLIVMGIKDMEARLNYNLNQQLLLTIWRVLAFFSTLTYILILLAPALSGLSLIMEFISVICFLIAIYRSKNMYKSIHR